MEHTANKTGISISEMAMRLGVSKSTANNLAHSEGFYPAFRIGKRIIIGVAALDRWVEEQTRKN